MEQGKRHHPARCKRGRTDELELRKYTGKENLTKGNFHIEEPTGEPISEWDTIDLAFIPGVSFDRQGNRLGRGKGYYDRLLHKASLYKIGICFHFQLRETPLPADALDIPMDEVWTENGRMY